MRSLCLLTLVCSELSSRFWYTRSFNIQPAKKHSFCRYCVISWGRFSTKKTLSNPSSPSGQSTFLSCGSLHQIVELWILLLHSFAKIKMIGLHLLQPASQDWPVRRKNTSNHCFGFINTLQSCLLLFDKTVNHLWRQFAKHSEHLDFWRRLEGIGAELHTLISSKCVSPKDSDFYAF